MTINRDERGDAKNCGVAGVYAELETEIQYNGSPVYGVPYVRMNMTLLE